jgi:glutathione S-transferase
MWNRRAELGLFAAVASVFRHLHPKMSHIEVPQIGAWGEANKTKVVEMLRLIDARLGESGYIAGGDFSIADITALVAVDFMKVMRLEVPSDLANIARWHREVSARSSTQA